ncbi:MAG: hypothetical protein IKU58_04100 [Clostridia bacterium]|nr:hypothetical protein [Clostridia bacterium]
MKHDQIQTYLHDLFDKYKYLLLICAVGLALLLWPQSETPDAQPGESARTEQADLELRLQAILEDMDGVGKARVLLTVAREGETEYAYDRSESQTVSQESSSQNRQQELVTLSENGGQVPVPLRRHGPVYRGAVVVCEGGDRAAVKLAVTEVIQSLTGLSADRIVISKMKQ